MKGVVFISVFLALAFAAALLSQAQEPSDKQQARQLAEQVLNGREAIIRLYADPTNNPRAFDRLAVKLDGLYVTSDAVRLAFAASKTAGQINVSFERLLASGEAARTTLGRLVQSAQAIQPVFEQIEKSVELIEQSTGHKFVPLWQFLDYESRLAPAPSVWSLPGLIADSANTASSALEQVLRSARGDVTLDKMLQAGKTFQEAVGPIDRSTKNLRLRPRTLVDFAEAVRAKLDPSAATAEQVNSAINQIIRAVEEITPALDRMVDDSKVLSSASKPIKSSVRAVERGLDKMLEQKVVAVIAEDQTDQAVAAVVGEFIYAQDYRFGPAFSIWPRELAPPRYKWCLFQDADKQPVAGAAVEVMIGRGYQWNEGVWLWIRETKLDEEGRLKTPRSGSGGFDKFIFMVHYPELGAVPVGPHAMELPNEQHRIYTVPMLPKDKWCVFKDALGNPIPKATVEIFYGPEWRTDKSRPAGKVQLDEQGRLKPPLLDPQLELCYFIVSHPDYGTALVEPSRFVRTEGPLASCTVPLGPKGTEADQRCIWGRVEDANGNGVSRAVIECRSLEIAGGGHISLISPYGSSGLRTITDQSGLFALLAPVGPNGSRPAPPGAKYRVQVQAPKQLALASYEGLLPAGQETIVTLLPTDPDYLPALIFYDEFGPVSDPEILGTIQIRVQKPDGSSWSAQTYKHWLQIKEFVPGIYYAAVDWNGKHYVFEPVDLSKERPQVVTFKPQRIIQETDIVFRGQVIHGLTGQPIAGAIVLTPPYRHIVHQFDADAEELQDVVPLYPEVSLNEAKLALLKDICGAAGLKIVQTDQNGQYQITLAAPTISASATLAAIKENFLGAQQQFSFLAIDSQAQADPARHLEFEPDQTGCVPVPPMKLFPAATIVIEPNVPTPAGQTKDSVRLNWFSFPGEKPDWFEAMGDYTYPKKNQGASLFYKVHLWPNRANRIYVAAGLEMTIEIRLSGRPECAPIIIPGLKLQQGQIVDLGKWEFGPTTKVAIKVIDQQGKPVEGVNVRQTKNGLYWGQQAITNHQGIAIFCVPLYSEGDFVVGCFGESLPSPLTERTRYQIAGQEDTGKEFTLQLSDEILSLIFK